MAWVSRALLATSAQARRPASRTSVSSLCSTGARRSVAEIYCSTGRSVSAACPTHRTRVPKDTRARNRSASSYRTRAQGMS